MNIPFDPPEMPLIAGHRPPLERATESPPEAFDLPRYAELTYQEYAYCPHAKPVDAWLCESFGICGGKHA